MKKQKPKIPRVVRIIRAQQRREDLALLKRRRQLVKGFGRALPHLYDDEMAALEAIIFTAVGRTVVQS